MIERELENEPFFSVLQLGPGNWLQPRSIKRRSSGRFHVPLFVRAFVFGARWRVPSPVTWPRPLSTTPARNKD